MFSRIFLPSCAEPCTECRWDLAELRRSSCQADGVRKDQLRNTFYLLREKSSRLTLVVFLDAVGVGSNFGAGGQGGFARLDLWWRVGMNCHFGMAQR